MNWYLAKIVYRIICGSGDHTPQFDEQLRLVVASSPAEAFARAAVIGIGESDTFYNQKQQLVRWEFINVSELFHLSSLVDGAEVCSQIKEVEDGEGYATFVHEKARAIAHPASDHLTT